MTAHKCEQLSFPEFLSGLATFYLDTPTLEYEKIFRQALEKPQNWQAEAKCGLCRILDGGNR